MPVQYTHQMFQAAVEHLASSVDPLPKRLYGAWMSGLFKLWPMTTDPDFPNATLQHEWKDIYAQLKTLKADPNGLFDTRANTMTEQEASQLIRRIVSLYDTITRMYGVDNFILTPDLS